MEGTWANFALLMNMKKRQGIPPSVIRRLTKYLTEVQRLRLTGREWVSSQELAEALDLTSSTVRQDLTHLDFHGVSKRGYQTEGLQRVLARVMGADSVWKMVVVGAGNLGRALALHEEFHRRGFEICGIFDNDVRIIGKKVGRLNILGIRELPKVVGELKIDLGVIAVPPVAAQAVADLLIASGVRGLLNMALAHIVAPTRVCVTDARIVASLLELTHAVQSNASGQAKASKN
jgi:redox-sensing transcriptional repressor